VKIEDNSIFRTNLAISGGMLTQNSNPNQYVLCYEKFYYLKSPSHNIIITFEAN